MSCKQAALTMFLLQSKWCVVAAAKPWSPSSLTPARLDSSTWIPATPHLDSSTQPPQITSPPPNLPLTPVHW